MGQDRLEEEVLRIMDEYADQVVRVEDLQKECDREATCDCTRDPRQRLVEAQRKMSELRGVLGELLNRLGYVPQPRCGEPC